MSKKIASRHIMTGVRNLDALFAGGLPKGSATLVCGPPGSGKTILTEQICFHNATTKQPVLYFNTLSEPVAKTLRYLKPFDFFDARKLEDCIKFVDLGVLMRTQGLEEASKLIMEQIKRVKPGIVVIDSFKAFDDLAASKGELRKFGYELAVNLMAWETTTFLLGEFGEDEIATNPAFSIVDGLILVTQREESGEQQRFIQVVKMRGVEHSRDEHAFEIRNTGIEVFAPRMTIHREDRDAGSRAGPDRCKTGNAKLDEILGEGIPRGSSLLIGGVAGTGKTLILLEFLYRGAKAGDKGIMFSFEETEERLRASARGVGWDLDREIDRGMIQIVFIPQPEIQIERHLLMMKDRIEAMSARRVAIDSVSVFMHKIKDPQIAREKTFQLCSVVQNAQAVGFFATDIPYGANQLSRFGVEETVVDGIVLLTSTEADLSRERFIEVYKLRNTAHLQGRHTLTISPEGISIFPRYDALAVEPPQPLESSRRLTSGVPGLDPLIGGGVLERSVTLVSGSAGIGKTTFGLQFIADGLQHKQPGLFVSFEESEAQLLRAADGLGLPLGKAVAASRCQFLYLASQHVRANQLVAMLADKIAAQKTRRLVLDSVSHIMGVAATEPISELLAALGARFKALGVTSVFTQEASSLYGTDTITERGFSAIADNIVTLRYVQLFGEARPALSVIKTRSSVHDRGTHYYSIKQGGIEIEDRAGGIGIPKRDATRKRGKSRRSG
jgi:circadian clock protein KaiC